jgi:hypothetical protein
MPGVIQAFEHSSSYTKNKNTDEDSYDVDGDNVDELEENFVQLAGINLSYNYIANDSDECSIVLLP